MLISIVWYYLVVLSILTNSKNS